VSLRHALTHTLVMMSLGRPDRPCCAPAVMLHFLSEFRRLATKGLRHCAWYYVIAFVSTSCENHTPNCFKATVNSMLMPSYTDVFSPQNAAIQQMSATLNRTTQTDKALTYHVR